MSTLRRARHRALVAVLCALTGGAVVLSGCAAGPRDPAGEATVAAPTTTSVPVSSDLTESDIAELVSSCPAALSGPGAAPEDLDQSQADALRLIARTGQCDDVRLVRERPADPDRVFVSPVQFAEPECAGQTVLSFWAHYDDDLIFGNPSIGTALAAGQCIRTVFFTYSDAGEGESTYAAERETGIRAAYDVMRGATGTWSSRLITLASGATVTLTRPDGDPRVSLMFLRLPDGGMQGSLFEYTGEQTLEKLNSGELPSLRTLDAGRSVSRPTLEKSVIELIDGYRADTVYTHLPRGADGSEGDHPDHRAVGEIVAAAVAASPVAAAVTYAQGYPSADRPVNLTDEQLTTKLAAFVAYAAHDPVIGCHDAVGCLARAHFGAWLQRQYLVPREAIG